jgi:cellulose synthase/poly-beta-1,6-N-acetylglucosamine synthase-like glycosyltransferase
LLIFQGLFRSKNLIKSNNKQEIKNTDSHSINKISESDLSVSLVICARNEYENIQKNISSWIAALEPNDELIIVNDRSEDKSPELLEQFARIHIILKIVHF